MIYGGGDKRLGEAVNGGAREGKALRDKFYRNNPAFKTYCLQSNAQSKAKAI